MSTYYTCKYPSSTGYTNAKSVADKIYALMHIDELTGLYQVLEVDGDYDRFKDTDGGLQSVEGGSATKGLKKHVEEYEAGNGSLDVSGARENYKY